MRLLIIVVCGLLLVETWICAGIVFPLQVLGGSMAPWLLGDHLLFVCLCAEKFRTVATREFISEKVICPACGRRLAVSEGIRLPGDRVIVFRKGVWNLDFRRFQPVCFADYASGQKLAIKRLAGLPGERIHLERGWVWINGRPAPSRAAEVWRYSLPVASIKLAADPVGIHTTSARSDPKSRTTAIVAASRSRCHDSEFLRSLVGQPPKSALPGVLAWRPVGYGVYFVPSCACYSFTVQGWLVHGTASFNQLFVIPQEVINRPVAIAARFLLTWRQVPREFSFVFYTGDGVTVTQFEGKSSGAGIKVRIFHESLSHTSSGESENTPVEIFLPQSRFWTPSLEIFWCEFPHEIAVSVAGREFFLPKSELGNRSGSHGLARPIVVSLCTPSEGKVTAWGDIRSKPYYYDTLDYVYAARLDYPPIDPHAFTKEPCHTSRSGGLKTFPNKVAQREGDPREIIPACCTAQVHFSPCGVTPGGWPVNVPFPSEFASRFGFAQAPLDGGHQESTVEHHPGGDQLPNSGGGIDCTPDQGISGYDSIEVSGAFGSTWEDMGHCPSNSFSGFPVILGDKEYFFIGDNPPISRDSRHLGPVREANGVLIVGVVVAKIRWYCWQWGGWRFQIPILTPVNYHW